MRILLADDHAMVRSAFKRLLAGAFKISELGEAADCQQALDAALAKPWDIVILDISMPGCGGLGVLKEIRAQRPQLPVLMVTMHAEQHFVVRAFRAGAAGYLHKTSLSGELIKAIESIRDGGLYLSTAMAEQWVAVRSYDTGDILHERLSKREFEILRRIASGKTVREIADNLHLSINTINTYRLRVLEKMQLFTNADLTRYAINNQLVA